uniref:CSON009294 protein n=1 Tax=Culicoides sonorensis TaxID=179676 RepID=A0A336M033_CULSO
MQILKKSAVAFTILLVILSLCTEEVDARRKILRGRRTVTRHYRRGMAIPAWAIVLLMGIGYLIIGAVLYLIMRKVVLQAPIENCARYKIQINFNAINCFSLLLEHNYMKS